LSLHSLLSSEPEVEDVVLLAFPRSSMASVLTRSSRFQTTPVQTLIESRSADVAQIEFEQGAFDIDTLADFERLRTEG